MPPLSKFQTRLLWTAIGAIITGFILMLTGCDMTTMPSNPTQAQIDSGRVKLDSVNAGKTIKFHAWQICVSGKSPEPTCPTCQRDSFAWDADLVIHQDSAVNIWMDRSNPTTCMPVGLFADTVSLELTGLGRNNHVDSVWLQIDGYTFPKYWMAWRRVTLHPDSLRIVADSVDRIHARDLYKAVVW